MMIIILVILVLAILWVATSYNRLITLVNKTAEAWSDINVQLKRRYDLIPNLVETVKGYAAHEQGTLEKVVNARNQAMSAHQGGTANEQVEAENFLSSTLKSLFALTENYPDLKANQNFLDLQRELTDTEDKIMASRRFYNGIFGRMLGFSSREFFEIKDEAQKEPVKVQF